MNRNNYYGRSNSRGLLSESVYDQMYLDALAQAFNMEPTELPADMQRLSKALGIASAIIKRQTGKEQVPIMQTILNVFEDEIAKGSASVQLTKSVKSGTYRPEEPAGMDQNQMEESRYRYGSRLSENRKPSYPKRMYPRY